MDRVFLVPVGPRFSLRVDVSDSFVLLLLDLLRAAPLQLRCMSAQRFVNFAQASFCANCLLNLTSEPRPVAMTCCVSPLRMSY